ncbi:hypothetical protein [Pseudidiomarina andamanensis]|uniref:Uncharacterized protein n=1 Tax=Pseudidiomarina andamanensis TaxID=1940690 RepID=A0AA92IM68_9GAMM|nr:hypothetical protein [Pseudidiomarina andamanensis]MDS0218875.1 hypothetical protein [Pseudidiomarina andamanensis]QGT96241.1 hypothetical protein D3795_08765 [Pseudidiomarina andamanensis]
MVRMFIAFLCAVIGATLVGTVIQTQFNLAELTALSVDIDMSTRMATILHDLLHFGPVFALILTPTLLIAFIVARVLSHLMPKFERAWFIIGGGVGLACAFSIVDSLAPMPTLIAANRTLLGFLLMSATGAFAGWIFDRLWHPQPQELAEELPQ